VYAKASEFSELRLLGESGAFGSNNTGVYNLSTGVASVAAGSPTVSMTSVGNGWWRCVWTATATATTTGVVQQRINTTGDGTSGLFIWGAQLSVGPNALDYTPTTTAVVYGPRFDYNPSTLVAQGLLIEEQRTNLWVQSEDFSNASWIKVRSSITADAAVSPSGKTTADKFIADTNNNFHFARQDVAVTSGTTYTQTIFAKAAEYSQIQLAFDADSSAFAGGSAIFTLTGSGSLSASGTLSSSSITLVGNGWYRCQISAPATATATGIFRIYAANGGAALFAGDGTSGIFIWGAQLEAGAFATSYIPTTTAATTRSADLASIGTLSPWYNAAEYTLYYEGMVQANSDGVVYTGIGDTFDNTAYFSRASPNQSWLVRSGASSVASLTTSFTPTADVPFKMAGTVKANDFAFCLNGGSVATDTSGAAPVSAVRLGIGNAPWAASGGNGRQQWIRRITYTPRRLTDAELQSLTS
jgi:hypothetical protein